MKTVLNIKTDLVIKEQAKSVAQELGLSLSAVVNAYLRQFSRDKAVYFSLAPKMTSGLEELIGPIENDIKSRRNLSKIIDSPQALTQHLERL